MSQPWTFLVLLPRNLCVVILRAYRAVISPLYGDVCRYYPSCSAYALHAIQGHGVIKGVWLGSLRIARCHPWAAGGVDDVPATALPGSVTRFGFVVSPDSRYAVQPLAAQHGMQHGQLDQHSLREHSVQHQGKG